MSRNLERAGNPCGELVLRTAGGGGCLTGTLKVGDAVSWMIGTIEGDRVTLLGDGASGEVRRDGERRVGTLRRWGFDYALNGTWHAGSGGLELVCEVRRA